MIYTEKFRQYCRYDDTVTKEWLILININGYCSLRAEWSSSREKKIIQFHKFYQKRFWDIRWSKDFYFYWSFVRANYFSSFLKIYFLLFWGKSDLKIVLLSQQKRGLEARAERLHGSGCFHNIPEFS
jgi:hypothetical protein